MATSNPAFSQDMFAGFQQVYGAPRSLVTTVQGTIGKTSLLLAILSATALWSWYAMAAGQLQIVRPAGRRHRRFRAGDDHHFQAHRWRRGRRRSMRPWRACFWALSLR